jgi:hypothetical protein
MVMRRAAISVIMLVGGLCITAVRADAQDAALGASDVLSLFFDCQGASCRDDDFFRREIAIVNWVRDREVSDLHVLVTSEATGGGGRQFSLSFIGRRRLAGQDQVLTVNSSGDATAAEQRQIIADRLKLGLVRYLADTPAASRIVVGMGAPDLAPGGRPQEAPGQQRDPWDFWVFRVGGNAFLNGESSFSSSNYSGNVSANRTTEAWKISVSGRYSRNRSEFVVDEAEPSIISLIEDWSGSSLVVKSLSPQWSIGVLGGAGRSSRLNEDLRWNLSPGIEYDFVPYSESSRRAFTLQALMNVRHWDYTEETVYFKTSETRLVPSLTASVNQIEPWGRANVSVTGSQYLHDTSLYQISVNGNLSIRIVRGLMFNVGGFYALVRDQIFLPAGSASTEEVLLRQRQLETSFNYFTSFGISYQFGSIFNNVVNPRFRNSGGF